MPAEGIRVSPVSQIRAIFPILKNPANRHKAVGFTPEQWHYAFTNTQSREEPDEVYERYHIPASGRLVWAGPLANFTPGHQETYVDFQNENRAPLLFIAGSEDNLMPPAVNQSNVKHYRHTSSPTEHKEFEGRSHYSVLGGEGWEETSADGMVGSCVRRDTSARFRSSLLQWTRRGNVTDGRKRTVGGPVRDPPRSPAGGGLQDARFDG